MRKLVLSLSIVIAFVFATTNVRAQITVTVSGTAVTSPALAGSYGTLATALTAVNAITSYTTPGTIILTCTAGTSETAPPTGLTLGSTTLNPLLSATNTITIIKGAGGPVTLNAGVGTATPASAAPDGIFKLFGADYVTIDGLTFTDGNSASATVAMEFGLALFKAGAGDGCNNNTIQNCIFNMQRVNNTTGTAPMVEGSVGILVINSTPTTATTALTPTNGGTSATNGSNSGNKFYTNTINSGNYGIVLSGYAASSGVGPAPTATTFLGDLSNDIGGSSGSTGNIILNFGGAAAATNPAAGIRANNQWSINISFNNVNNNDGGGVNHVTTLRGIYAQAGTSGSANINNNTVSVKSGATTSAMTAIENVIGTTAASNTININNNIIQNCSYTTAGAATFSGILNGATAATVNANGNTVNNNTLGAVGTGSSAIFQSIYSSVSATNFNASSNTITNNTILNQGGTFYGIRGSTSLLTWNNNIINNNAFTNTGAALSSSLYGLYDLSSPTQENFSGNLIDNLSISGSSTSASSVITGINMNTILASTKSWTGNVIHTLTFNNSSTGACTVTGMAHTAGTLINIFKNKIYNLTSNGASSDVIGISVSTGVTINIYNNLIGDLKAPTANIANAIRGITSSNTTAGSVVNIYYNTIYVNASSSGTNFGTTGVFLTGSATAANGTATLRNNIIYNSSTANGTGFTVAYRRSTGAASTLANYGSSSNNNDFYAGAPGASNLIYYDGTSSAQTIAAYKAGAFTAGTIAPRDNASFSDQVIATSFFQSTAGANVNFLKYNIGASLQVENGGSNIATYTDDYTGTIRAGNGGYGGTGSFPDVGAWELEGIPADLIGPAISYSPLGNTACLTDRTVTPVTITDASGVNITAGTRPRLYYKKSGDANTFADNTNGTNGWKYVEATGAGGSPFSFTTDYSLLFTGAPIVGESIVYFVVAQDLVGTPNVGINTGTFNTAPTSVALVAANFPVTGTGSYTFVNGLSGTVNVGASQTYHSLTEAGNFGLFNVINNGALSGNLTVNIMDATAITESGATALNTVSYGGCSPGTFTILIKPNTTAILTGSTSGALIRLNGADYVTIDGSNSGGTDRSLTITNTGTTTPSVLQMISLGTGQGATNNTIKNCNINVTTSSSAAYGISIGGSTVGSAGADNDDVTIQNNIISTASIGIYSNGSANTSTGGTDNLNINGNSITNSTSLAATYGMQIGNAINATISQNTLDIQNTAGNAPVGISIETGTNNSTITRNKITRVQYVGTGGFGGRGITVGTGSASSNITISNNVIYGINGDNFSSFSNSSSMGIGIGMIGNSTTITTIAGGINVYFNSIHMYGNYARASTVTTACLFVGTGASALNVRNNSFQNSMFNTTQASSNYAIYSVASNAAYTNINYNDYFGTGAQGVLGFLGSAQTTLAAWQTATGQDANSIAADPLYNSTTNLVPQNGSPLVAAGVTGTGTTIDYTGFTRGNPPTIGAYEQAFDQNAPVISYTPVSGTTCMTNLTLSPVTITDGSGINVTPGTKPRMYFKKSSDANTYAGNTSADNGWKYVEATNASSPFSFTTDYSLLQSPVVAGNTIQYFIVAQDIATPANLTINSGTFAAAPSSVALTSAAFPLTGTINSYTFFTGLGTSLTIGPSGDYSSLTGIGGFFEDLNTKGLTGNTTVEISVNNVAETGANGLNPITYGCSGTYTLTIKPASGVFPTLLGSNALALVGLNGADNVIFDGSNSGGTSRDMTIRNVNATGAALGFANDATFNTVKNINLEAANTSTTSGVLGFGTSTGTLGNSNNEIDNCAIRDRSDIVAPMANGVYSAGTTSAPNAANTIENCEIFNFTTNGINLTATGIGNGWQVKNNHFYNTLATPPSTAQVSILVSGGSSHVISTNAIGGQSPNTAGSAWVNSGAIIFTGISLSGVGASGAVSVQGNTIANINLTTADASLGTFNGMLIAGASTVNIGTTVGNTIGNSITANSIQSSGGATFIGINSTSSGAMNISNNLVANMTGTGTNTTVGMRGISHTGTGAFTCVGNSILKLTGAAQTVSNTTSALLGIYDASSSTNQVISDNSVRNLVLTHPSAGNTVTGININSSASTGVARRNKVSGLENPSNSTTSNIRGIQIILGSWVIENNMVSITNGSNTSGPTLHGIADIGATGPTTINFNSVYIGGSGSSGSNNSYAYLRTGSNNTLRNNIFYNARVDGAGTHYAIGNTAAAPGTGWSSNYNDLYSSDLTKVGEWGANNAYSFSQWQTISSNDANSVCGNPQFISASDLHINTGIATVVESKGVTFGGVTTDLDGDTRSGTPDIGADEGSFIQLPANDVQASAFIDPANGGTKVSGVAFSPNALFSNVGLSNQTNVPVRYRIVGPSPATTVVYNQTGVISALNSSASSNFVFPSVIVAAPGTYTIYARTELVGDAVPANDEITGTITMAANPLCGVYAIGASQPLGYQNLTQVLDILQQVGVTCPVTFELQADYNSATETFPITFAPYTGMNSTDKITVKPAAGVTTSITGSASSIIKLNGIDFMVLDGSNNGSTSRDLTITNTSTSTLTTAVWVTSTGAGAGSTNNTVKNCNISANADQSTGTLVTFGIIENGVINITNTAPQQDNDNNSYINNFITKARYGIFCVGESAANPNQGTTISNNLIGPAAFGATQIGKGGIVMLNQNNMVISGNEIRFVGGTNALTTGGTDRVGIAMATDAAWPAPTSTTITNATVTGNKIHDIVEERTFAAAGIVMGGGVTLPSNNLVANNMMYNIHGNGTSTDQTVGIGIAQGDGDNVVFNSIYLYGDIDPTPATTASQSSVGIRISTTTPANLTLKNNAIHSDVNSNTATLKHYAIVAPSAAYAWGTGGCDRNIYYVNSANPQMVLGGIGTTVPYTAVSTLAAWQGTFTPAQDAFSSALNPQFVSGTDLHINNTIPTPVESAGITIAGVTTDFDGQTRSGTPDIGADEGSFIAVVANDVAATVFVDPVNNDIKVQNVPFAPIATFTNYGTANQASVPVRYRIVGPSPSTTVVYNQTGSIPTLNAGASANNTFPNATISVAGTYTIYAKSELAGDGNTANDEIVGTITVEPALCGDYLVGASQPAPFNTLTNAITKLNNVGVSCPVRFLLTDANYSASETFPLNISDFPGGSATNTFKIVPNAGAVSISGVDAYSLFILNGCQYVTIDGRVLEAGSTNSLTIANTTGSAVVLVTDAHNNTVKYTDLKSDLTTPTSGVVYFSSTAGTNGNDNNTIDHCRISGNAATPINGIYAAGTTTSTAHYNSGNTISNCEIFNFYNNASTTNGGTGINIGIGNTDWTINGNSFYQTSTRTVFGNGATVSAILSSSPNMSGLIITNNYIGGTAAQCGGGTMLYNTANTLIYRAILLTVGTTTPTSLQGNTIQSISISTASTSQFQSLISAAAGDINIGNITGNTLGSQSTTGSVNFTQNTGVTGIQYYGILAGTGTAGAFNFSNNTIGGITVSSSLSSGAISFRGISVQGSPTSLTISGNTIGSTTTASSFVNNTNASTLPIVSFAPTLSQTITNNTIANVTSTFNGTSATITGMLLQGATGGSMSVTGNTIHDLTSSSNSPNFGGSASVIGISFIANTSPGSNISQNTVYNLSNTNSSDPVGLTGIHVNMATSGTNIVERNRIYGLSLPNNFDNTSDIRGINFSAGLANVQNNMVALGGDAISASVIRGIHEVGVSAGSGVYFNSVYIGGSVLFGGGDANTYAFSSDGTTNARTFQDNIFVNARTNAATTSKHYAVTVAGTAPNPTGLTINYNDYLSSGVFGLFNSLDVANLNGWRAAVGQDGGSISSNPQFIDPANLTNPNLHIHASNPTPIEGAGLPIAGINDDYDGQTRASFSPTDMGADAGNFVVLDISGPVIVYTPLINGSCLTDRTLAPVSITDGSGINTTPGTKPRLYFKKSTDANTYAGNTSGDNGWKFVEATNAATPFSFTTNYALLQSPVVATDVIQYFVVAQDLAGTPNVGINSGIFAAAPSSVALTAAAFPLTGTINSYTVVAAGLTGTVSVGAAQTYHSLTESGAFGLFNAINTVGLSGNLVVNIVDASVTESGAVALNAITYNGCTTPPYTLLIKPNTTATLTGSVSSDAMIKLNGADNVTIDGSNNGSSSRDLTITNTATAAPTAIALISTGTGQGATNNTIKNCNISTGVNSSVGYGISIGGAPGTAGADNDNNTIQNNNITEAVTSIYANGAAATSIDGMDNLVVTGNSLSYTTALSSVIAMRIGNALNATVSNNTVSIETSAALIAGISLEAGVSNSSVSKNVISKVKSTAPATIPVVRGIVVGPGSATSNITISNNMIYNVISAYATTNVGSGPAGILLGATGVGTTFSIVTGGVNIYYNSVNLFGNVDRNAATHAYGMFLGTACTSLNIRNNILSNSIVNVNASGTGHKSFAIYSQSANSAFTTINYNDYYASGTQAVLGFLTSDRATLADWQTATGQDANSIAVNPKFVSATNLHIDVSATSPVDNAGIPVAGITSDIDGDTRHATTPDIGADEFTGVLCSGAVGGTASSPGFVCGPGVPVITASGYSIGAGSGYQWMFSTNPSDYPLAGAPVVGETNPASLNAGTVSVTTYFWLKVTCNTGTAVDYSNMITITVNAVPTASAGSNSPVCSGQTLNLTGTTNGASFSWTGPNGFSSGAQNPSITNVPIAASGTYTFIATLNGCPSAPSTTNVVINVTPTGVVATASVNAVCPNTPFDLFTALNPMSGSVTENFDALTPPALPAGWVSNIQTGTNGIQWTTVTGTASSAPNSAFIDDPVGVHDKRLTTPTINIFSGTAQLTFKNNYIFEGTGSSYFDGGVLEISLDNGTNWNDIIAAGGSFVTGGYVGVISSTFSNPLAGRNAWGQSSGGFITTTVNLPAAAAGQSIKLRWRMGSDASLSGTGWWIDDVQLTDNINPTFSWVSTPAGFTSSAQNPVGVTQTVATDYTVTVFGTGGCSATASTGIIGISCGIPNDDAPGAIGITLGATCSGSPYTNTGATQSSLEPYPACQGTAGFHTAWYSFTAPASGTVRISTDHSGGTMGADSRVSLYSTTNVNDYSTFTNMGCSDDNGSTVAGRSVLYMTGLTAGTTYYIQVDGKDNSTAMGTFCLTVEEMNAGMLSTASACAAGMSLTNVNDNYTGWMSLVDGTSKLIAMVKNPAGGATTSTYSPFINVNTGAVRNDGMERFYLDRNITINNASVTNVDVRFFLLNTELAALQAADPVVTLANLQVTRQTGTTCDNDFVEANGTNSGIAQTGNGTGTGFSWINYNTPAFSKFYAHTKKGFIPAKVWLQGAYRGTPTNRHRDNNASWTSIMNANALNQPYNIAPFTYLGTESVPAGTFATNAAATDPMDWVLLELRNSSTPATVMATRAALIREDGKVVDVNGNSDPAFRPSHNVADGNYFIVIRHRNHLAVRSNIVRPLNSYLGGASSPHDFTVLGSAYTDPGVPQNPPEKDLTGGAYGMFAGNGNANTTVRANGGASTAINDYQYLITLALGGSVTTIVPNVYHRADFNMDGNIRANGGASTAVNDYQMLITGALGGSVIIIVTNHL